MSVYDYYITDEEYGIALKNGISYDHVNSRIRGLGWSKEKAITKPVKRYKSRKKKYGEWVKLAESNGIAYTTFVSRMVNGMDVETAATKPTRCNKEWAKNMRERRMEKLELRKLSGEKRNESRSVRV